MDVRTTFPLKPLCSLRLFDDSVSSLNADIFGLISIRPHYSGLKLTRDLPDRLTQGNQAPISSCDQIPYLASQLIQDKWHGLE